MTEKKSKDLITQVKDLLPILVIVCSLAGFFYTTQHRLERSEKTIEDLEAKINTLNDELSDVSKELKRVKRKKD